MAIFKVIKRNGAIVDGRKYNKYDILDTPHDNVTQSSDALLVKLGENVGNILSQSSFGSQPLKRNFRLCKFRTNR